jgi:hypothetical protein
MSSMELGGFAPYVLCLYLPLVPWERFRRKPPATEAVEDRPPEPAAAKGG